ncbi:hypothetical protein WJX73_000746 [Symbiochloris irregularis]|uniref:Uncharacterized protein n=1 Tax=Symbiochloris irregularis TaxID=706552 RepID=A0AAW1NL23_9CHLO
MVAVGINAWSRVAQRHRPASAAWSQITQRRSPVRSFLRQAQAAAANNSVYRVSYKDASRDLTQAQIEKAPESLLGKLMVQANTEAGATDAAKSLEVPCEESEHCSAGCFDGDVDIFQVCMDCYTGGVHPSRKADTYSATELKPALVEVFKLPAEMWPPGFAVGMEACQLAERRRLVRTAAARQLLSTCVEVSH